MRRMIGGAVQLTGYATIGGTIFVSIADKPCITLTDRNLLVSVDLKSAGLDDFFNAANGQRRCS